MNVEDIRMWALAHKDVEEGFPFGEDTLVFKAGGKIFLLLSLTSTPLQFNVKCDPEKVIELREQYECVLPGYHMNKRHWNTVVADGTLTGKQLKEMIDHSYSLVYKQPKKQKQQ
ncbi:MAG: MmcQ/YjbR family DNA-binding protein [Bacteroidota bacterium]